MIQTNTLIGQIVRDRSRSALKGAAIVLGLAKHPGQLRICRWRGAVLHWSQPVAIDAGQLELIADWTLIPLTEAKRLAAAVFERIYLVRAMESAKDSLVDAALAAGVDRSNFRRLLQRHGLVKMPPRPKRRAKWPKQSKKRRSK